jgi:hypothetical protein
MPSLLTRNASDFAQIPVLKTEDWTTPLDRNHYIRYKTQDANKLQDTDSQ